MLLSVFSHFFLFLHIYTKISDFTLFEKELWAYLLFFKCLFVGIFRNKIKEG